MTIKEIKFKWDGQGKALSAAEIDFLLSEITRLTAELKEREGEVERLQDEVRDACGYAHDMESLAASRLADQERIEKHTEKRVARECAEIAGGCYYAKTMAEAIKKKYGVE